MSLNPIRYVYVDINSAFGENNQRVLLTDIEAINVQIYNLLSTNIGDVDYEPFLGSGLPDRIFDQNYSVTETELKQDVHRALTQWLGDRISVRVNDTQIMADYAQRRIRLKMNYYYKRLGVVVNVEMIFGNAGLTANLANS